MALEESVRNSQQQLATVRKMLQLHCTGNDSRRKPETIGDSERHEATPWDWRNSKREHAIKGDS